jgi:hypothetical protein
VAKKQRKGGGRSKLREALLEVGEQIVRDEQQNLRARLVIHDDDGPLVLEALSFVGGLGLAGIMQSAAILMRVAEEVCVVVPSRATGPQGAGVNRRGLAEGWAAAVIVGRRAGGLIGRLYHGIPRANGKTELTRSPVPQADLVRNGDFTAAAFVVDPALDDRLARLGFPGAVRRLGAEVVAVAPDKGAVRAAIPRMPNAPWETARDATDLLDLTPQGLGFVPAYTTPSAPPVDMMTRALPDLVAACAQDEAMALHLARRVALDADPVAAVERIRDDERLSPAVRAFCIAHAAGQAFEAGEQYGLQLGVQLMAAVDTLTGEDPIGWLRARWPASPTPGDELVTAWAALVAVDSFWRLLRCHDALPKGSSSSVGAPSQPTAPVRDTLPKGTSSSVGAPLQHTAPVHDTPPEGASSSLGAPLRHMALVRDTLLDLAGVGPGEPGERIVQLTAQVLEQPQPPWGEPRIERFREARGRLPGRAAARVVLPAYALWHAVTLHAVWTIGALELAHREGAAAHDLDPAGLLGRGRHVLARTLVLDGMHEGDAALLDRAVQVAPWDATVRRVANEGRHRLGRRDAALLADLRAEERDGGTVGTAAEALSVALEVGDIAAARSARRRLRERATGEVATLVTLRLALDRIADLQDSDRVDELSAAVPTEPPADSRVVHALLGADPAAMLRGWRSALTGQRDALCWAALVREERAETTPAPRVRRPACPEEAVAGALPAAHKALRWRLDRRGLAHHPLKPALEEHARAALELVATDDAASGVAWLSALGGDCGLVAALDRAIAGEDSALAGALAAATTALYEALAARWLTSVHERLRAVWSTGADPENHRERTAIEAAAAQADDGESRSRVDSRVGALLERAVTGSLKAEQPEDEAPGDEAPGDRFAPMRVPAAALEHGRRVLLTPEWAVQ